MNKKEKCRFIIGLNNKKWGVMPLGGNYMEKIKELIEQKESEWKIADKYIKLEQFECYNPRNFRLFMHNLCTGKWDNEAFLSEILDLEKEQYSLFSYCDTLLGNFCDLNFMDTWDLLREMMLLVSPYRELKEGLIADWTSGYTSEKFESENFTPKEDIIEWLLDGSEEQLESLIDFKKKYEAMYK
jgi:hypothetical protein